MSECVFCGERIFKSSETGVWHHESDEAIVCAIGLGTNPPDEIVFIQYATPSDQKEP